MTNFVEIKIKKQYESFLLNIQTEINEGEIYSILGHSGSGKTTLLRIIAGFEKMDFGFVKKNNIDITLVSPEKRNIGFVFQDLALFPHLTIKENIGYSLRIKKIKKNLRDQAIIQYAKILSIESLLHRYPATLSGGEKQRVALARTMISGTDIILFDEPFSSLDQELRSDLRKEFKSIINKENRTAIFVTHDVSEAFEISDKIILLHNGQIEQTGFANELYSKPTSIYAAAFFNSGNTIPLDNELFLFTQSKNYQLGNFILNIDTLYQGSESFILLPETAISLHSEKNKNSDMCIIKNIDYKGEYYSICIEYMEHVLRTRIYSMPSFSLNSHVYFSIDTKKVSICLKKSQ